MFNTLINIPIPKCLFFKLYFSLQQSDLPSSMILMPARCPYSRKPNVPF